MKLTPSSRVEQRTRREKMEIVRGLRMEQGSAEFVDQRPMELGY